MTDSFLRRDLQRVMNKHSESANIDSFAIVWKDSSDDTTVSFYSNPTMGLQNGIVYLLTDVINKRLSNLD